MSEKEETHVVKQDRNRSVEYKNDQAGNVNEPLSGSKKVKNRNHSNQNHGEGS